MSLSVIPLRSSSSNPFEVSAIQEIVKSQHKSNSLFNREIYSRILTVVFGAFVVLNMTLEGLIAIGLVPFSITKLAIDLVNPRLITNHVSFRAIFIHLRKLALYTTALMRTPSIIINPKAAPAMYNIISLCYLNPKALSFSSLLNYVWTHQTILGTSAFLIATVVLHRSGMLTPPLVDPNKEDTFEQPTQSGQTTGSDQTIVPHDPAATSPLMGLACPESDDFRTPLVEKPLESPAIGFPENSTDPLPMESSTWDSKLDDLKPTDENPRVDPNTVFLTRKAEAMDNIILFLQRGVLGLLGICLYKESCLKVTPSNTQPRGETSATLPSTNLNTSSQPTKPSSTLISQTSAERATHMSQPPVLTPLNINSPASLKHTNKISVQTTYPISAKREASDAASGDERIAEALLSKNQPLKMKAHSQPKLGGGSKHLPNKQQEQKRIQSGQENIDPQTVKEFNHTLPHKPVIMSTSHQPHPPIKLDR